MFLHIIGDITSSHFEFVTVLGLTQNISQRGIESDVAGGEAFELKALTKGTKMNVLTH